MAANAPASQPSGMSEEEIQGEIEKVEEAELVSLLNSYWEDARSARETGYDNRDDVWNSNFNLYWKRFDWTAKADWQHKEVMPEVTTLVDRFAAALKRSIIRGGEDWYTVTDPAFREPAADLLPIIKRFTDLFLSQCSTNKVGTPVDFPAVFSNVSSMGALMAMAVSVIWDEKAKRVAIEPVDPRELYFDPTGRGMYRVREFEMDKHKLLMMANQKFLDDDGNEVGTVYKVDRIKPLQDMKRENSEKDQETSKGHGPGTGPTRGRVTLKLKEFYFKELVNLDGELVGEDVFVLMANDQAIIRGPEANPFWHGQDWIQYHPVIDVPLSVYGRSYVEDFAGLARTFTELTNLILDSTWISTMKSFAMKGEALVDPGQIQDGMYPNKIWNLDEDANLADFIQEIDIGGVNPTAFQVWQGIDSKMREKAFQNEIDLGQVPGKSGITATEVLSVRESGSELLDEIAEGIDLNFLSPVIELTFWTAMQHSNPETDPTIEAELGPEVAAMLTAVRGDFKGRRFRFQAAAVTGLVKRNQQLQRLLSFLQIIGQNELLAQDFLQKHSIGKIVAMVMKLIGIEEEKFARGPEDAPPPKPAQAQAAQIRGDAQSQIAQAQAEAAAAAPPNGTGTA